MSRIFRGQQFSFILYLSVAAVIFLRPAPGICETADYTDKAQNIHNELVAKKAAHAALLKKSTALNAEVSDLKKNLVRISKDLRLSEDNLSETDQNLQDLRQKKGRIIKNIYNDQEAMDGLVAAVKKYAQTSTPDMLMQTNPIDASRASLIMKSLMPRIQQQSAALKSRLAEIKEIEEDITNQLKIQTQQANKLDKQQDGLAILLQRRQIMYQSTESQRITQEREVARLTKQSRNIDDLIQRLKSIDKEEEGEDDTAEDVPMTSRMIQPVHGKIRTAFGQMDDLGARSKGITFSTRPGASVVIPLAGIVEFAGPFQKYKQILIVEHKGGYHSLVAGLARIDTVVGASLAAGEPVGVADTSGSPRIYYELRHNGKPVNPQRLLLAQRKQEKS